METRPGTTLGKTPKEQSRIDRRNKTYRKLQRARRRLLYGPSTLNVPVQWPLLLDNVVLPSRAEFHQRYPHPLGERANDPDSQWLSNTVEISPWSWSTRELPDKPHRPKWPTLGPDDQLRVFQHLNHFRLQQSFRPLIMRRFFSPDQPMPHHRHTHQKANTRQQLRQTTTAEPETMLDDAAQLVRRVVFSILDRITETYKTRNTNYVNDLHCHYDWDEIFLAALFTDISPTAIRSALQRIKYAFGSEVDVSQIMRMVDGLNTPEAPAQYTFSNSIFGIEPAFEDEAQGVLLTVEDMLYKDEPAYMALTRPSQVMYHGAATQAIDDIHAMQSNQLAFRMTKQYAMERVELRRQIERTNRERQERQRAMVLQERLEANAAAQQAEIAAQQARAAAQAAHFAAEQAAQQAAAMKTAAFAAARLYESSASSSNSPSPSIPTPPRKRERYQ